MYKISIQHLEEAKKALEKSNKVLFYDISSTPQSNLVEKTIQENKKVIEILNQYLGTEKNA